MKCIIAVEKPNAVVIKEDLLRTGLYSDWEFTVVNSVKELMLWSRERPDVLVLSRFFEEEAAGKLLVRLKEMFPATHIVLLVGTVDEKGRAYIKKAMECGLNNIVTGKLPGDRPYNLVYALTHTRDGSSLDDWDITDEAEKEEKEEMEDFAGLDTPAFEEREDNGFDAPAWNSFDREIAEKDFPGSPVKTLAQEIEELAVRKQPGEELALDEEDDYIWEPAVKPVQSVRAFKPEPIRKPALAKPRTLNEPQRMPGNYKQGIFLVTSANKGGVGKTTVAITLAVALARSNVPVVLCDFDFAAPDVATFFDLKNKKVVGIEYLAGKPIKKHYVEEVLTKVEENLYVLPGPMDQTIPRFEDGQMGELIAMLKTMFPVTVGDTPPEFWMKPWLAEIFEKADLVLAVVDQSKLSEQETRDYAPMLVSMGVTPERIKIVLNRFSPKLHNARLVEKYFNAGFRKDVPAKHLPKVVASIPEDWDAHVQKGYKGEVVGLEDAYSQWHRLAEEIAAMAGYKYNLPENKPRGLKALFKR
jgi:MinD-like ATPase involved in chromosome partitioning or flagellar assembly